MVKKILRSEAIKKIDNFFLDIKNKSSKEIKKIKRIAMKHNLPLKEKRKTFCKKCLIPYKTPKIRIKKGLKIITCDVCGYSSRWKIKN